MALQLPVQPCLPGICKNLKIHKERATITHLQRPEIFGDSDILRMKGFLIQNAANV